MTRWGLHFRGLWSSAQEVSILFQLLSSYTWRALAVIVDPFSSVSFLCKRPTVDPHQHSHTGQETRLQRWFWKKSALAPTKWTLWNSLDHPQRHKHFIGSWPYVTSGDTWITSHNHIRLTIQTRWGWYPKIFKTPNNLVFGINRLIC